MEDELISEGERWEIEGDLAGEVIRIQWDSWNSRDPAKVAKAAWEILKPHLAWGSIDRQTVVKYEHKRQDAAGSWALWSTPEVECTFDED